MNPDHKQGTNVFWLERAAARSYPALTEDISVDVAIVGAGMVGLHCAWALADSGLSVALVEARRIGEQATGRSTAKVTSQHGLRYAGLVRDLGKAHASVHAQENEKALRSIADLSERIGADAGFERRDAFIYARNEREAKQLEEEEAAARAAGIEATIEREVRAPIEATASLRFPQQAQFDPFGYLQGLAGLMPENVQIYEQSRVERVEYGSPCIVRANGQQIRAARVVVATQMPIVSEGHFFAKAFPFAHAVAAAPLPEGIAVDGMFISAAHPSHSFRTASRNGQTFLIAAGNEYRPGEPDAQRRTVEDLRAFLRQYFRIEEPSHLWTNEDFRSMDATAFIGQAGKKYPNFFVATGFSAWGITQGAMAGEILAAALQGREHPASSLYDATRLKPLAGGARFMKNNMEAGGHLVGDRLLKRKDVALNDIEAGQGGVVSGSGGQLAVRRDHSGATTALSAVCTHMGCVVDWNPADRTWDCPCHGSRFDEDGAVLAGPATSPLEPRRLRDSEDTDE